MEIMELIKKLLNYKTKDEIVEKISYDVPTREMLEKQSSAKTLRK